MFQSSFVFYNYWTYLCHPSSTYVATILYLIFFKYFFYFLDPQDSRKICHEKYVVRRKILYIASPHFFFPHEDRPMFDVFSSTLHYTTRKNEDLLPFCLPCCSSWMGEDHHSNQVRSKRRKKERTSSFPSKNNKHAPWNILIKSFTTLHLY